MLKASEPVVQPRGNVLVDHTVEVTAASDLKNNNPVVVVDRADVAKDCYHLAGGPWCLNDPEREQWPAPINGRLEGREDAVVGVKGVVGAKVVADDVPRHGSSPLGRLDPALDAESATLPNDTASGLAPGPTVAIPR